MSPYGKHAAVVLCVIMRGASHPIRTSCDHYAVHDIDVKEATVPIPSPQSPDPVTPRI